MRSVMSGHAHQHSEAVQQRILAAVAALDPVPEFASSRPEGDELQAVKDWVCIRVDGTSEPIRARGRPSANAAPDGAHYLWPALWNSLSHRPDVPRQLRCELLITLRAGDRVVSWLDVLPDDFTPLPRVTSREEGMRVSQLLDRSPSVREWLLREGGGSGQP